MKRVSASSVPSVVKVKKSKVSGLSPAQRLGRSAWDRLNSTRNAPEPARSIPGQKRIESPARTPFWFARSIFVL